MKKILFSALVPIVALVSQVAVADIAVIVNQSNNSAIDDKLIERAFFKKATKFDDGSSITPYTPDDGAATRTEFEDKVLGKSESQMKAYWSKLIFTGKGNPPDKLSSDTAIIEKVKSDSSAISYVDAASVTSDVKVVKQF